MVAIHNYYFAVSLALIVISFISGVFFGSSILSDTESKLTSAIEQSELNMESYYIQQVFLESFHENPCEVAEQQINTLSAELYQIGQQLVGEDAERALGAQYRTLKTRYHLLQARTYLLVAQAERECETTYDVILYYYGTEAEASAQQAAALDTVLEERDVRIFAIEKGYVPQLAFLEDYYDIHTTPALVINHEWVFHDVTEADMIIEALERY